MRKNVRKIPSLFILLSLFLSSHNLVSRMYEKNQKNREKIHRNIANEYLIYGDFSHSVLINIIFTLVVFVNHDDGRKMEMTFYYASGLSLLSNEQMKRSF